MTTGPQQLSRRERQIMDLLYEHGRASARDIHNGIPDTPSYSAVRALLAILVDKGQINFEQVGARYIYTPARPLSHARQGALRRLIKTFFGGSTGGAANALLGMGAKELEDDELDELAAVIERERSRRRE